MPLSSIRKSRLADQMRALGPYVAIEALLPGGSLIVLAVCVFRHRGWLAARARRGLATLQAFGAGLFSAR